MYYVEITGSQITGKMQTDIEQPLIKISEEIYNQLTYLPASYTLDEYGNILTVTPAEPPAPAPAPPTTEERLTAAEAAILDLMGV